MSTISSGSTQSSSASSLGNGIDVQGTVGALMQSARRPEVLMQQQQTSLNTQSTALKAINSNLVDLQAKVQALTDFTGQLGARTVTSSNSGLLTATADGSATLTNHQIIVNNLATTSSFYTNTVQNGSTALATGSFDVLINGTTIWPIHSANRPTLAAASTGAFASVRPEVTTFQQGDYIDIQVTAIYP